MAAGKKIESGLLKLFYRENLGDLTRVGIATSSQTFKKAHLRNRARRLVSTGFEQLYDKLKVGISIIALPKEEVLNHNSKEVAQDLEQLLKKAGLLDEKNFN